jgi:hypothetical protein
MKGSCPKSGFHLLSKSETLDYVVPEVLVPINIDLDLNIGRYIEPNVWVHHPITTERLAPPQFT